MAWIRACSIEELEEGDSVRLDTTPPVAVFNVDGEFFAIADICSHDDSSLADGYLDGDVVECSWHFAKFCVRTGAVLSPPATKPVSSYTVKIDDDSVLVDVPHG